jgi:hypothetical protein
MIDVLFTCFCVAVGLWASIVSRGWLRALNLTCLGANVSLLAAQLTGAL